jgi:hypothetical protein
MTNQLFCLATHLRLAMLCLQLGKSCWVLVLDSFFRHEEMSQLRFAETLFSCQFFQAGYTASNELPHGGNGKTNQHVGEMMMMIMMMMMMFIVSTTFVIFFKLLLLHMTMLHCHDYQYFLPTQRRFFLASNKSFWNICWVSSGAVKVFGTDSTLPDLVSWNKYTTHLFFKVYK